MAGELWIRDSDVNWIAYWEAQIHQARPVCLEAIEADVHATLSAGEEMLQTLNLEVLMRSPDLIEADLKNESTGFDVLFSNLFGSFGSVGEAAVTTIGEAERLRRVSPINDVSMVKMFAWQIPHLFPPLSPRSIFLASHYWTLLSLRWLARWDKNPERCECPRKCNDPWVQMPQGAELLRRQEKIG